MAANGKYPVELRERAVRLYRESDSKPVIRLLAEQLNVHPEALRNWIRQAEAERGDRPTTAMIAENRRLLAENRALRRVNEVLRAASAYFAAEIGPTRRGLPSPTRHHTTPTTRRPKIFVFTGISTRNERPATAAYLRQPGLVGA